ncbi:MAG: ABC transporter ATP-binding protein [Eubacteriales bacterium]|nr:ABC transporter ATP-binding protein [Eubacteriales bacterium]
MVEEKSGRSGEIRIEHVSKRFENPDGGSVTALNDVSLTVEAGSFVSLIGPSGCGKTTLLRAIAGLHPADEGVVLLDGKPVGAAGADRGYVFQQANLFPWLNIRNNVAFGLKARGVYRQEQQEVDRFLELVGLKDFAKSYPHQLSGGMCQRAALARALVGHPKVLLLDEPLGALDAFTRMNMQDVILELWRTYRMTMIMVTHDVDEAIYLSDRVVVMSARPARVEKTVEIELSRPRDRGQEDFLRYRKKILEQLHFAGNSREPDYYL